VCACVRVCTDGTPPQAVELLRGQPRALKVLLDNCEAAHATHIPELVEAVRADGGFNTTTILLAHDVRLGAGTATSTLWGGVGWAG
jgi:hypothetical protein